MTSDTDAMNDTERQIVEWLREPDNSKSGCHLLTLLRIAKAIEAGAHREKRDG